MWADASIYSKKTKTAFYFDKLYNIKILEEDFNSSTTTSFYADKLGTIESCNYYGSSKEMISYCEDVYDRLIGDNKIVLVDDCIRYINILLKYKEDKNYLELILEYLNLLPINDEVFVVTTYREEPKGYEIKYDFLDRYLFRFDDDYNRIEVKNKYIYDGKIIDIVENRIKRINEILLK